MISEEHTPEGTLIKVRVHEELAAELTPFARHRSPEPEPQSPAQPYDEGPAPGWGGPPSWHTRGH